MGGELELTGWLVQREGKPIHGIRVVIRRGLSRTRSKSARRKRRRPEVAAAFPDLPDAWSSGFLFELRLGLGRSHLTFQVLDHERLLANVSHRFGRLLSAHLPLAASADEAIAHRGIATPLRPAPRTKELRSCRRRIAFRHRAAAPHTH